MSNHNSRTPTLLPVLSRGKHRNPRKGACFMELASYLAGERWSDHPACTHPLLAAVARSVNDATSDAGRHRLAPLIPSVIGTAGDDVRVDARVDARIALLCAATALPLVAEERQRVLAVSLLTCESVLAQLSGRPRPLDDGAELDPRTVAALDAVPHAAAWARRFTAGASRRWQAPSMRDFRQHAAPHTVGYAVIGIASACIPSPDDVLHDLLVAAIAECTPTVAAPVGAVDGAAWRDACRLTGVR